MKKLASIFAVLIVVCVVWAAPAISQADTGSEYAYNVLGDGTAEIMGYNGTATELQVPAEIDGYTVTGIGYHAFRQCREVEKIQLPETVETIGERAFSACVELKEINLPEGLKEIGEYAFECCYALESVELPDALESIGHGAFYSAGVKEIAIPDSVTYLGGNIFEESSLETAAVGSGVKTLDETFRWCTELKNVQLSDGLESIKSLTFADCKSLESIDIPSTVKVIGDMAFYECVSLKEVTLHEGLEQIDDSAFGDCKALTNIVLPQTATELNGSVFLNCSNLTGIELPAGITSLDNCLFGGCTSLKNITVPANVESIDNSAFSESGIRNIYVDENNANYSSKSGLLTDKSCSTLLYYPAARTAASIVTPVGITTIAEGAFFENTTVKTITLSKYVTSIDADAFDKFTVLQKYVVNSNNAVYSAKNGVLFNKSQTKIVLYPDANTRTSYTIPDGVTTIGAESFKDAKHLANVVFNGGIRTIGKEAFHNCDKITKLNLLGKITTMGDKAFAECSGLKTVTIGNQVTVIGNNAFDGALMITKVKIGNRVKKIGDYAFDKCSYMKAVKIPSSVTSIGKYALHTNGYWMNGEGYEEYFYEPIDKVYYSGSKSKWKAVAGSAQYKPEKYNYCDGSGKGHAYKKMLTKATRFHNGSYDTRCSRCGDIKAKVSTIYKIDTIKLSYVKAKYNGKVKTPSVTVKNINGKKLKKGTDYTVKYESGRKNPGNYTVTVSFKGKYYGTVKRDFKIVK